MPKLRITVTHTHAGVVYSPGHIIEVDEYSARWLIDHGIGHLLPDTERVSTPELAIQLEPAAQPEPTAQPDPQTAPAARKPSRSPRTHQE